MTVDLRTAAATLQTQVVSNQRPTSDSYSLEGIVHSNTHLRVTDEDKIMIKFDNELITEFHFIHSSSLNVGDKPPELIEPFICPEMAMNSLNSSETKNLATFDLSGKFTAQLESRCDIEKVSNKNTMFVVAVGRGGEAPKESKVFKIFSDGDKAFACRDIQNKEYQSSEVFAFDCEIINKFSTMEEVSKVWELYS